MGGARKLWIAAAVVACATALAACGGGGSTTTTGTGTETAVPAPQQSGAGAGATSPSGPQAGESGSGGSPGSESTTGPGPKKGERSYAFRTPGGDNSIQEYGSEGNSSERAEAQQGVSALYAAFASGNWAEICHKYLSATNLEQIKLLAEKSPQIKGKSCPEVLGGLNRVSGGKTGDRPVGGVASLRREGDTAFALYRGVDGNGYALPLKLEGGQWKLTALAPTPLQLP